MEIIDKQKQRIVEKILETNDTYILHEMDRLIDEVNEHGVVYHLTEKQEKMIQESKEQFKNGNVSSHDEVFDRIEKWLKK